MLQNILLISTGIVLFLFGMIELSSGIQRVLNLRIREYIKRSVKKPLYGIISGMLTTGIVQGSAATIVLVIGLVSAGLITFYNSMGIVLGADIGTTITAQLVAWRVTSIAPIFIVVGVLIWLIGKERQKSLGQAIFYFGLLFFGLSLVSQGLAYFKNNPDFVDFLRKPRSSFLGILVGLIFTILIQSSSATASILVLLGQQGLITIESALPIILGANIGTTSTALLASLGVGYAGRRTVLFHVFCKILGVILFLPFVAFYISFLKSLTSNLPQQIAWAHILFNVILALIFLPFLKPIAAGIRKVIPGREKLLPLWPEWLDKRHLNNPRVALEAVKKELGRMAILSQRMFHKANGIVFNFKKSKMNDISYIEIAVDNLQGEIMEYLDKISGAKLTIKEADQVLHYTAMVDDLERIADHATNIAKLAKYKTNFNVSFSEGAQNDLRRIQDLVGQNLKGMITLINKPERKEIEKIFAREEEVDQLVKEMREGHLERFFKGICAAEAGPIFVDLLINYERISDHCMNIAEYASETLG